MKTDTAETPENPNQGFTAKMVKLSGEALAAARTAGGPAPTQQAPDSQEGSGATPQDQAEAPEDLEGDGDGEDRDPRLGKARKEAKGLRDRLHDAETQRDFLTERLTTLQTAEVSRLASGQGALAYGPDLFNAGVTMPELLNEQGDIDEDKVAAAVAKVIVDRPHWASQTSRPSSSRPSERLTGGGDPTRQEKSWLDVLKG